MSIPERIADAVVRAANEHGAPNSFSPGELAAYYGARLGPMAIGRHASAAVAVLAARGWVVTYERVRTQSAGPWCGFRITIAGTGYDA